MFNNEDIYINEYGNTFYIAVKSNLNPSYKIFKEVDTSRIPLSDESMKRKKQKFVNIINNLNIKGDYIIDCFDWSLSGPGTFTAGQVMYDTQNKEFKNTQSQFENLPQLNIFNYENKRNVTLETFKKGFIFLSNIKKILDKSNAGINQRNKINIKLPNKEILSFNKDFLNDNFHFKINDEEISMEDMFNKIAYSDLSKDKFILISAEETNPKPKEKPERKERTINPEKLPVLKSAFKNIIKNLETNESVTFLYNKGEKSLKIKKIDNKTVEINSNDFPCRKIPTIIKKYKDLNDKNYHILLKDFFEDIKFKENFYLDNPNESTVEKFQEFNKNNDISISSSKRKEKEERKKILNTYKKMINMNENFNSICLDITHKLEKEIEEERGKPLEIKESNEIMYFKSNLAWNTFIKTFEYLGCKVEKLSDYDFILNIDDNKYEWSLKKDNTTYNNELSKFHEKNNFIPFEKSFLENTNMYSESYIFLTSLNLKKDLFEKKEYDNIWSMLGYNYNWSFKNDFEKNLKIKRDNYGTKYSVPNNLIYPLKGSYGITNTRNIINKFFRIMIDDFKLSNQIDMEELNQIDKNYFIKKDYDKNKIVYTTNDNYKTIIDIEL